MIIKINGLSKDAYNRVNSELNKRWKKDISIDEEGLYYVTLGDNVIIKTSTGRDHITLDLAGNLVDIMVDEFITIKMC